MNKLKSKLVKFIILVLIGVGIFLRFGYLGMVPAAFYHDEMDYVLTGQSIVRFGTDLSGTWFPFSLKPLRTINITAELPAVFHAATQYIWGDSVAASRLTNAFFGIGIIGLIYLLSFTLTARKLYAYMAGLVMLVNPWHIHISRLGYEATISVFFQLLTLWGLLKLFPHPKIVVENKQIRRRFYLIVTIIALCLGYFTYHGAKFTLPIIIGTYGLWWMLAYKRVPLKSMLVVVGVIGLLVSYSLWGNYKGYFGWRSQNDIYNQKTAAMLVDEVRRDKIPFRSDKLTINKYVVSIQEIVKRYWFVFDPNRLLVTGYEGTHQFSLVVFGYFGLAEVLGLIIYLRSKSKHPYDQLIFMLILVTPISTLIAGYQAILRSAMTYCLIAMVSGWGLAKFIESNKQANYGWRMVGVLVVMLGSSVWFGLQYFGRYALVTAENHMLSERLVARYVKSALQPIEVVVDISPYNTARSILYYNNWFDKLNETSRKQFAFPFPATIRIDNITITSECPKKLTNSPLVITPSKWKTCGLEQQYSDLTSNKLPITALPSPLDNGSYYFLWQNEMCNNNGNDFIHLKSLADLNIEKLTDLNFCKIWIKQER